jgi:hypothetical protein
MSSAKSASDSIKKRVVIEPLRPRRNPNRIGYQAVAAGEKRTAGEIEGNQKTPRKTPKRRICIYLLFGFFINSNPDLTKEILNNEFA